MKYFYYITFILLFPFLNSCLERDNPLDEQSGLPKLTTSTVLDIDGSSALGGGSLTSDGTIKYSANNPNADTSPAPVIERGICWNTSSKPTVKDNKSVYINTSQYLSGKDFSCSITGLSPNTKYYVRAYATNRNGIGYGNEIVFTTTAANQIATVAINSVTLITENTATVNSNLSFNGRSKVTQRGVCWSTYSNPTVVDLHTSDGIGDGLFSSSLTGLKPNTVYYIRAYATNSVGTAYSSEVKFVTNGTIADIDGNVYHTISIGNQKWMVENLKTTRYNDGTPIALVTDPNAWGSLATAGYCWYNNLITNKSTYGALYNWAAVNNGKLALAGWHVPTDADWKILSDYLGGEAVVGSKLKSIGFSPVFGGNRATDGTFNGISSIEYWWSSTQSSTTNAWQISFGSTNSDFLKQNNAKSRGFSVRCVRNN